MPRLVRSRLITKHRNPSEFRVAIISATDLSITYPPNDAAKTFGLPPLRMQASSRPMLPVYWASQAERSQA